jgi:hypothetical protein
VTLIRNDVSEEYSSSIIRVTIIGELGTTVAVISIISSGTEAAYFLLAA